VTSKEYAEKLALLRRRLRWSQDEMGAFLGVTREWVSRLENGNVKFSELVILKMNQLADAKLDHGVVIPPSVFKVQDFKPKSTGPSMREDCEEYFTKLLFAAERSGNPNAFPVIHDRLQKFFPLSEWTTSPGAAPPPLGSIVITPDDLAQMKKVVAKENARALNQTITAAESRPPK
jgi:transcriptional regulator with XRE-family HTH domain